MTAGNSKAGSSATRNPGHNKPPEAGAQSRSSDREWGVFHLCGPLSSLGIYILME